MSSVVGREIQVHEASVSTATVEVKTLTISGKQVTLAVFRQLQEAEVIDEMTGKLVGIPWGRVNYHPEKCAHEGEHLHVVWQQGNELRRSASFSDHELSSGWVRHLATLETAALWYTAARVLEGWRPDWAGKHWPSYETAKERGFSQLPRMTWKWRDYSPSVKLTDAMLRLWHPDRARQVDPQTGVSRYGWMDGEQSSESKEAKFAAEQEQMRQEVKTLCAAYSSEQIWEDDIVPSLDALDRFTADWAKSYKQLIVLDQLFIAV